LVGVFAGAAKALAATTKAAKNIEIFFIMIKFLS
jgi:hypothetical protein